MKLPLLTALPALDGAHRRPVPWAFYETALSAAYFMGIFTDLSILTAYPTAYPMGTFMKLPLSTALPALDGAWAFHEPAYLNCLSDDLFYGHFTNLPYLNCLSDGLSNGHFHETAHFTCPSGGLFHGHFMKLPFL
jgi:hypothetical protein